MNKFVLLRDELTNEVFNIREDEVDVFVEAYDCPFNLVVVGVSK